MGPWEQGNFPEAGGRNPESEDPLLCKFLQESKMNL